MMVEILKIDNVQEIITTVRIVLRVTSVFLFPFTTLLKYLKKNMISEPRSSGLEVVINH